MGDAWINGRTLRQALAATGARNRFGRIAPTARIPLDLAQDSYVLGIEHVHGVPFVVEGDLVATIHDFDLSGPSPRFAPGAPVIELANMRFTRRALESGAAPFVDDADGNDTRRVERMARALDLRDIDAVLEFSRAVCIWGQGSRVWGNLTRLNEPRALGSALSDWLATARETCDPGAAIAPGVAIKGLRASFASKHLRMLDPKRFATLDEVISTGLGYAMNVAGFRLWLHDLQRLKAQHDLSLRIADIESGIFVLIRQQVRGLATVDAVDEAE